MIDVALLTACAPNVAVQTTQAIIRVESKGDPLAIGVNHGRLIRQPRDAADAAQLARAYIAKGYNVDLGLMQVNSRNLASLGYRVEDMFDVCTNVTAGARVLSVFYAQARPRYASEQVALRAALSAYNTGNFVKGFSNGYVARYSHRGQWSDATSGLAPPLLPLVQIPPADPFTVQSVVLTQRMKEQAAFAARAPLPAQFTPTGPVSPGDLDAPRIAWRAERRPRVDARSASGSTTAVDAGRPEEFVENDSSGGTDAWSANVARFGPRPVAAMDRSASVAPFADSTAVIVRGQRVRSEGR